jgi:hypothetical protein
VQTTTDSIDIAELVNLDAAALLNKGCFCVNLDRAALRRALESELGSPGLSELVEERCPYVFAAHPVFVTAEHTRKMAELITAVESVVAMPAYRAEVLANAPEIARHDPHGAKGVFFGYDFHVHEHGVGLIEINTNAGGAMLNTILARAQRACCAPVEAIFAATDFAGFDDRIIRMFRNEWNPAARGRPLRTIAIVDDAPEQQYLYPEFLLFQQLFTRNGLHAVITDPSALQMRDGKLWHGDLAIDMVYNRLTDFALETAPTKSLRAAYLQDAIALTPHPQAHALYADKRNLALLSDPERLTRLGVAETVQAILLASIPHTESVTESNAERLWTERRKLFFKPIAGYGGRAAYRGDKLTKRVWGEILAGEYVAQSIVLPGERVMDAEDDPQILKFDVRDYVYDGEVQWVAARLYQGQTTNFRTPGGGFAPVYSLPDGRSIAGCAPCDGTQRSLE